ncbi:MAG: M23 family metallopeptidase [Oscillospiraceae bacterium]|nr:M23 family metallopeptidase [Oscillospiraceae bacterium]
MQNNNKSKGFRSFVKEKGYYIVLLLCAVAVATSGYFLLTADKTPAAPTVTAPTTATAATVPPDAPTRRAANAIATQGAEPTEPTSPKRLVTIRPAGGETVNSFAADHLAYNETTRDWRTHEGVDFRCEAGQSVTAAADGTVYTVYEDQSYGMTVVLQHANGYTTHYANLSKDVPVSVGDSVKAGQVIGTVGDTACVETALEPHLHFAVYKDNSPVDPAEFF